MIRLNFAKINWMKIIALIIVQSFIFTGYVAPYPGSEYSARTDLRPTAVGENTGKVNELAQSLLGGTFESSNILGHLDVILSQAKLSPGSWKENRDLAFLYVKKFLENSNKVLKDVKEGQLKDEEVEVKLVEILGGIQKIITLPHLHDKEAAGLRKNITELWVSVGELQERARLEAIEALEIQELNRMNNAHIVVRGEKFAVEDLPADSWSAYSAEIWAPYLNEDIKNLIEKLELNLDIEGNLLLPAKIGRLETEQVQNLIDIDKNDHLKRLMAYVDLENNVRKEPAEAIKIAEKISWGKIDNIEDFSAFINEFLQAMRYFKYYENWMTKKDTMTKQADDLKIIKEGLNLASIDPQTIALRLTSLNIPVEVVKKVAQGTMRKSDVYYNKGEELLKAGLIRNMAMAGGTASRWKSSLASLIDKGLVSDKEVPGGLPRALAAYWIGGYIEGGYTGIGLMFDNLLNMEEYGYKPNVAYVLSPYTWENFMKETWQILEKENKGLEISVMAQNSAEAMVIEKGRITGERIGAKVLGHGNIRGWIPAVIEGLKKGIVYDIPHSADNPFAQLNTRQIKEITGVMSEETLAHVGMGNWRNIGQMGGGYVNVNGIPDIVDTAISKEPNKDNFVANRDINIFSVFISVINNAALLYAVSGGVQVNGEDLISWSEVQEISKGNRDFIERLKNKLNNITAEQETIMVRNFINLLPSEYVVKKEGGKEFIQWEQISGMLHGAIPVAIRARQKNEGVRWEQPLSLAYVDISLNDFNILYGKGMAVIETGKYLPAFVEIKSASDLYTVKEDVQNITSIMSSQFKLFSQDVQKKINLSRWAGIFPEINHRLDKGKLADLKEENNPRAVLINYRLLEDNPGMGIAVINANKQLGKNKRLKFVLAYENPNEVEAFYQKIEKATEGAVDLKEQFDLVVSAAEKPDSVKKIVDKIKNEFGNIETIEVLGPRSWSLAYQGMPGIKDCIVVVCEIGEGNSVAQGALALWKGLDALVKEGVLTEEEKHGLFTLKDSREDFFRVKTEEVGEDTGRLIDTYREIVSSE